ncbi:MAG: FG-GAP-like repeat-containing protein [Bacteroidia bacterium]
MKKQLLLSVFAITGLIVSAQPTITSFTPVSGPIGTSVTITGTNFNTTAANNSVYFGATKATVSAATASSLTVTVPSEATYQNIAATNTATGLSGYSSKPFITTFPCGGVINANTFGAKVDFTTGTSPFNVAIGDIDGDGKSDLVVANTGTTTVSVFRNTSTAGTISFAAKVDFTTGTAPQGVALGDLDGDGKLDVAVADNGTSRVSVYRNLSTVGTVSLSAKTDYTTGINPSGVVIGDIDGNGKPEIVTANSTANTVSVLRNTCTVGTISFGTKVDFTTGTSPFAVAVGDVDGDGKPELAVSNNGVSTVSVLRNTATTGTITAASFAAKVDFTTGTNPYGIALGDIDGDGKPEIAAANSGAATVSVLRNTSTSGTVTAGSFAAKVDFATGTNPFGVALSDIDGDGKIDMAASNSNATSASLLKNTATSGTITAGSFAAKVDFTTGAQPYSIAVGDLDGDNKPDFATTNFGAAKVSTFLNLMGGSSTMTSANTATVCSGVALSLALTSSVTSSYSWVAADNTNTTGESTTTQTTTTLSDVITNTTTSVQSVIYTVTPTANTSTCPGTAQTVTITVNPAPVMTSAGTATICTGGTVNISLASSTPSTYTWIAANNPNTTGESTTTQSTATLSNVITNTTTSVQNVIYTVTPTATGGGSCLGISQTVTVSVNPTPAMTSATATTVCSGAPLNLTFASNAPSTYTWIAADNANTTGESLTTQTTSVLNNTITSTSASAQVVIYTVTPTSTGGSCAGISQTVSVTVNPLPVITVNSPTICAFGSTTLCANGGTTYSWTPAGGLSATTGACVTTSNSTSVNYSVTGTDGNGCKNSAIAALTVNPSPTVTANASSTSICAGGTVTLTGSGANTYTWSNGVVDGVSFTPTVTATYTVTGTDANGCTNSATKAVTVNPLPTVTANATPTVACAGGNITFNGGGANTYNWSGPNAFSSSQQNPTINNIPIVASGTYTVSGTDANGCVNTATVAITINSLPNITANASPSASICFGGTVTLNGGGGTAYAWTGGVSNGVAFSPFITKTYTVTGSDANSCVNTATITVTVNSPPAITASASSTVICMGSSVTLNGGGANTYTWTGGITNGVAFTPTATATYSVTGTSLAGCTGNTASVTVTVNSADTSVTLTSHTLTANAGNASFQWMDCSTGFTISGATFQAFAPVVDGNYAVIVSQNGCVDTSSCYLMTGIGIQENYANVKVSIYPNPNNGEFNLTMSQFDNLKTSVVEIFNLLGEKVYSVKLDHANSAHDITTFKPGIYQLKVINNNQIIHLGKIIKQ